jgi:arylsulfatase
MGNDDGFIVQLPTSTATFHKRKGQRYSQFIFLAAVGLLCAMIVTNHRKLMGYLPSTALQLFEAPLVERQDPPQGPPHEPAKNECNDSSTRTGQTCSSKKDRKQHKPLNIVLLYGDDWRHDSLGVASGGEVKTPFLDSLAEQGIRFTHNCVTTAICWISRATLYMGQYMSRHNSTKIVLPYFYEHWNDSFVRHLQTKAGYYVGHVGKWHFRDYGQIQGLWNFSRDYSGTHWFRRRGGKGQVHVTQRNEEDAIEFLESRPRDVPFFLSVCFFAPHAVDHKIEQYFPQPTSMEWYANDTINRSISATDEAWKLMPSFFGGGKA